MLHVNEISLNISRQQIFYWKKEILSEKKEILSKKKEILFKTVRTIYWKKRKKNNFYRKHLRFVWTKRQSTIWFHNKSLESQTLVFFFHLMISLSVWNVKT